MSCRGVQHWVLSWIAIIWKTWNSRAKQIGWAFSLGRLSKELLGGVFSEGKTGFYHTLKVSSICHKTLLPKRMHIALCITLAHLQGWCVTNVIGIFKQDIRGIVQNIYEYAHILYIENASLWYPFSLSHSLLSLFRSPALSYVGGSTGHTAMPHQYAKWWNISPLL